MILTVTPNTALDVTYTVDELVPDAVLRPSTVRRRAGGKGINVARVLHTLGAEVTAVAFAGGPDGELVRADLQDSRMAHELVPVAGHTRRTTTLLSSVDDTVTLLNEPGPVVSEVEWNALLAAVRRRLPSASVLVCSGSLPPGAPTNGYAPLIRMASDHEVPVVLDTSGAALRAGIQAGPTVVKPNAEELREITGVEAPLRAARDLRARGAAAVLVSLGADGLLASTDSGVWRARPTRKLVGNTTGAGDAAVAGIAVELAKGATWSDLLRRAVALSSAAVLGPLAGDIDVEHYRREHRVVIVEEDHATGVNG